MNTLLLRTVLAVTLALPTAKGRAQTAEPARLDPASGAHPVEDLRQWIALSRKDRPPITAQAFAAAPLGREDAKKAATLLWDDHTAMVRERSAAEMQAKALEMNGLRMKFETVEFGDSKLRPQGGRSLFISLHGGGGAPPEVNESQWHNQVQLAAGYHPAEGIYLAPRAPTDAWNLWHQPHIDAFLERIIEDEIVFPGVNPNRVYIMGYSAGGDGVYQLAPRMADRWAAAAMMAGHPNDASPIGLRNIGFAIQAGANDGAYDRNKIAAEWGRKLDALQKADPEGYPHFTELYAGKGHWMDMEDRKAIPWMEKFTRNPIPARIAWHQSPVLHQSYYWLRAAAPHTADEVFAERRGSAITIQASAGVGELTVLLNDALVDLDSPVSVTRNGRTGFNGRVSRTIGKLAATIADRGDPFLAFPAAVTVPAK